MEFHSVNKLLEKSFRENWDRPALSNYKGQDLAYLIQLLRDNYGVVKDKEAEAKNTLVTFTQNDTAKMTYAIGDIFKQKLA